HSTLERKRGVRVQCPCSFLRFPMPQYPILADAELKGKRVLLRAGFDVPMEKGKVVDTSRVEAILPTMRHILDAGASLVIMAHQGRPKSKDDLEFSQQPLVAIL